MKEEKNKNKIVFIFYLAASICFFISAISGFTVGNNMSIAHLCLGGCFFCLSSVYYKKYKDKKIEDKE